MSESTPALGATHFDEGEVVTQHIEAIEALSRECFRIAAEHGFHKTPNPVPQSLCLIHSEVSEALEAYRDDDIALRYDERGKPEGLIVELADAVIRILDTAHEIAPGQFGEALVAKMAYNETRIPGHGRVRL